MSNVGSALVAYFYFDFKDTGKQDARALLSSLLVQLFDQSDPCCDTLSSLYSRHKRGSEQPTIVSLRLCLKDMLKEVGSLPTYLIVDALDECPDYPGIPSPREKVLELVGELCRVSPSKFASIHYKPSGVRHLCRASAFGHSTSIPPR